MHLKDDCVKSIGIVSTKPHWPWLMWQVGIPLGGPIVLSGLIILAWQTGNPEFVPQWRIALDVSPWSLTFYALVLVGSSLNELWPRMSAEPAMGWLLIVLASVTEIYAAFLVVWRHNSAFVPHWHVYVFAAVTLFLSIVLGNSAYSKSRGI